jgi:hypothetical protein
MITERTIIGKIEVLETGEVQIRQDTIIERDGVEITRVFLRRVLEPGGDVSREIDTRVQGIAGVVWTPEVIEAYRLRKLKAAEDAIEALGDKNRPQRV